MEGGIKAWQGVVATGAYEVGLFLLDDIEDQSDLIRIAWALEDASRAFYVAARERFPEEAFRTTIDALIGAEERHRERLADAYVRLRPKRPLEPSAAQGRMEGIVTLDDALAWLRAPERTLIEVLEASMQIEANSLDFYLKTIERAGDEDVKRVLRWVEKEERAHLTRLAALLDAAVRGAPGDWHE
jgi:rubrerythrin